LSPEFRSHAREKYPWLKLAYVPPDVTPAAQPVDLGVAAQYKALLRRSYGLWVCSEVVEHLDGGGAPGDMKLNFGARSLKCRLAEWTADAHELMSANLEKIKHAWWGGASNTLHPYSCFEARVERECFQRLKLKYDNSFQILLSI